MALATFWAPSVQKWSLYEGKKFRESEMKGEKNWRLISKKASWFVVF